MRDRFAPAQIVRDAVTEGDRRRRRQAGHRLVARMLPYAAGAVLAVAAASRWLGWPPMAIAVCAGSAALALIVMYVAQIGRRDTGDCTAETIDRDARLGGELRSAHWFAADSAHTAWTDYHVQRAADHVAGVSWSDIYPPVRAARAWMSSVAMIIGAAAILLWMPEWPSAEGLRSPISRDEKAGAAAVTPVIPQDIPKALALLAEGNLSPAEVQELAEKVLADSSIDSKLREQLEKLVEQAKQDAKSGAGSGQAGQPDLSKEGQEGQPSPMDEQQEWALEDAASKMANQQAQKTPQNRPDSRSMEGQGAEKSKPSAGQQQPEGGAPEKEGGEPTDADGGAGLDVPSDTKGSPSHGAASSGADGSREFRPRDSEKAIAEALKQEVIRPGQSPDGRTIQSEDRHRTEAARSGVAFANTNAAAGADVRADVTLPVPEARRALLERYFVRDAK
jgi:hypothetical protein